MQPEQDDISRLIGRLGEDDGSAAAALLPLVYGHLRDLAGHYFAGQAANHTLQPTALVHEAYLKLVGAHGQPQGFRGREHFLAVAARAMRQVLVDHARRRNAARRDVGRRGAPTANGDGDPLGEQIDIRQEGSADTTRFDVIELDAALRRLAELDPRKAEIVTLQYFGGLELDAIAEVIGISRATVARELTFARAWLGNELRGGSEA